MATNNRQTTEVSKKSQGIPAVRIEELERTAYVNYSASVAGAARDLFDFMEPQVYSGMRPAEVAA